MDYPEWWATALYIFAAFLLVLLNAFFVLTEFAIVKVRATHVETLARAGDARARSTLDIIRHLNDYLSVCQLGITIASLGLGWLGEPAFAALFKRLFDLPGFWSGAVSHSAGLIAAFLFIMFLHIVVGELAPKQLAIIRSDTVSLKNALPIRFFRMLFYFPMKALNAGSNTVLRLLGIPPIQTTEADHSEQEIRLILGMAHNKGLFSFDRLLLFENLFDFGGLTVKNMMVPWEKAVCMRVDRSWEENREKIRSHRFSRYPLIEGERRVVGMVHLKDLVVGDDPFAAAPDWKVVARPSLTIAASDRADALLRKFQQARRHLAVVTEQENPVGIVTMEDVLEELVGSIEDEFERGPLYLLTEVLSAESIMPNVTASSVEEAIRSMIVTLPESVSRRVPPDAFEKVRARELAMSSYLGQGVCVPHARLEAMDRPLLILGISTQGIPLRDRAEKAHFLFVLLTPDHLPHAHVRILARIAAAIHSRYVRERLKSARTAGEIMEIVRSADTIGVS